MKAAGDAQLQGLARGEGGRGSHSGAGAPALGVLLRTGPAAHAYSAARAGASDVPAPLFTLRGRVCLLGIDVYVEERRGHVPLYLTTLVGEPADLRAERLPIHPRADDSPLGPAIGSDCEVLTGPGSVWAVEPIPDALLWTAYFWPVSPGAALEGCS